MSVFEEYGKKIKGYDFGEGICESNLYISPDKFERLDLTKPFDKAERYDLAMCLEVIEHISGPDGDKLIDIITSSAPLVLFSAAIPGQWGTHHVNEQYPSYWIRKFQKRGFDCFDIIRPKFWSNLEIPYWYRQNLLIFKDKNHAIPWLDNMKKVDLESPQALVDVVHPEHLEQKLRMIYKMAEKLERIGRSNK